MHRASIVSTDILFIKHLLRLSIDRRALKNLLLIKELLNVFKAVYRFFMGSRQSKAQISMKELLQIFHGRIGSP